MSVEGLVTPSGVCVPVEISEPEYWLPLFTLPDDDLLLLRFAEGFLVAEPPRLAEEPDLDALRPPVELLEALFLEAAFLGADFLDPAFLLAPRRDDLDAVFLEALFLEADFFEADFLEAAFLELPFLAADFLEATFLEADFLRPAFFEAAFLEEPPRLDFLAAPFLDAAFLEDLPPELLFEDFLAADFLVDFAIVNGFLMRVNKFLFEITMM